MQEGIPSYCIDLRQWKSNDFDVYLKNESTSLTKILSIPIKHFKRTLRNLFYKKTELDYLRDNLFILYHKRILKIYQLEKSKEEQKFFDSLPITKKRELKLKRIIKD
jgi:hypothetical protein